ncbi:UvrD-helicase domain-containing protein [Anaerocolumna sedimenticola]|uniref:DNA 3'-5' helicase n=1 Tax=Anaerocolumna sedimenticola TaxID=2696063 RepID=A0A6P1TJY6_9FIRM|nr:UvrD-helicase domain-containing protein [Anaerocolumna sedimenticola]QHQ61414.1 UvrD-helicase domain-containing protein [Anaerocolumna sedimenticola]
MADTLLNGLNEEQIQAVTATEGYIRVIAGAGSGKTRALTHRFTYLVNELGIAASNILCVTFTNKAANEMKKRIRYMIGDNDTGFICTFHGFCVQVLKEEIHVLNYPKNFLIIDTEDVTAILHTIFEDMGLNSRNYTFSTITDMIAVRKEKEPYLAYILETNNDVLKEKFLTAESKEDAIFYRYLYEQKKCYALDFDDLINYVLYIFENHEEIKLKWQKKLEYVMVDEFQDVSPKQYMLSKLLSGYHHNLFIVGDPDQTIYSWRGANVEFILNFDKAFPTAKTIIMNKNYRSTPNIIQASNSLIEKNKRRIEKSLVPIKQADIPVIYNHMKTTQLEAEWIAAQIKKIQEGGISLKNIAILYRSHFVSRSFEEVFIKENIKYTIYSGIEFYKRKEIKDVLCYLRMILYSDDISFNRIVNIPKRNIGEKRMTFLKEYAGNHSCSLYQALQDNLEDNLFKKTNGKDFTALIEKYKQLYEEKKISEVLSDILNDSGYEALLRTDGEQERLDNLAELKQSIFDYENSAGEECTLADYLEKISLFTNLDQKENSDSVQMMTIHTAKGLEFPYVFVCGLNEGIFPSKHIDTSDKMEEERRLAYVAFTRAENTLFLSDAEGVNYDGSYRYPSRFIFNIEKTYINYMVELESRLASDARMYIQLNEQKMEQNSRCLAINDLVEHHVFGKGKILDINHDTSSYVIKFENMETTRNISFKIMLEYAGHEE